MNKGDCFAPLSALIRKVIGGGTPERDTEKYWNGRIPWATVKDFQDGKYQILTTKEHISDEGLRYSAANLIDPLIPIVCTRMAVGRISIANFHVAINQDLKALYPEDGVLAKYLLYVVDAIRSYLESLSTGSTVNGIRINELISAEVFFPQYEEQTQIATILSTIDRAIEQTEALIAKQQRIKTGLMQDLLTKGIDEDGNIRSEETHEFKDSPLGRIPVEWEVEKLNKLAYQIIDGTHFTPIYVESGIPFLRVVDINAEIIDFKGSKFISDKEHRFLCKRCKPEVGDILYSKNGTVGIPKMVEWGWEFSIFVSLALIKLRNEIVLSRFMEIVLSSECVKRQIMLRAKQGTVTNLHLEEIREFDIPVPSVIEQKKITEMSNMINSARQNEQSKYEKLVSLKNGLMQDLLTGKVRVTDLLDNPPIPT